MINALIDEDSPVAQEFLMQILRSDPAIHIVGTAKRGKEAREVVKRTRPDVITVAADMANTEGLETARSIMETYPTPIVILWGGSTPEVTTTAAVLEAGALTIIPRPRGIGHPEDAQTAEAAHSTGEADGWGAGGATLAVRARPAARSSHVCRGGVE